MAVDPLFNQGVAVPSVKEAREKIRKEIYLSLGGGMIDLELDPEHYDLAIDKALERYRTRSSNSVEESFLFLEVQRDQTEYTLPSEVMEVRAGWRRGVGTATAGGGTYMDPFSAAYAGQFYMMPQGTGGLSTYWLAAGYQETVGKLFGIKLLFQWSPQSKKITFHRRFLGEEVILLQTHNYRPDEILLTETYSRQWLREYAIAATKFMLGEARSVYAQIAGPQGGTTLNGEQLKADAQARMDQLDDELHRLMDMQDEGYGFLIG